MRRIIYTADDEEPDCGRCDHVCDSDNLEDYLKAVKDEMGIDLQVSRGLGA